MDADGSSTIVYILLLLILVAFNAFFAMSEMAIVSLNDNKIKRMAEDGDKKAQKLLNFIEHPTNFLSTIQIGVTLSGFLASAIAADTFAEIIVKRFAHIVPLTPNMLRIVSLLIITLLLSYLTLIFGELVPKRVAMQHYEVISFSIVGILSFMTAFLKPFVYIVSTSTNAVLRLIGIDPDQKPEEITEEEIRMMLDVGKESGHIHESDRDMIDNIFEFDDRYVDDIMTHRTEIVAIEKNSSLDNIYKTAVESGYSRIPVYQDDLDNIVGVLYVKDLLQFAQEKKDSDKFDIEQFLRAPLYTIESTTGKSLLSQFKETKIQMAIVVDEYGGTAGLVSMEDLMESIVGNIQDEYDDEEDEIFEISENSFIVDGLTPLEEVFRYFEMGTPSDDDDFDTIGGYVLNRLGQIPGEDERPTVSIGNIIFTIEEMNERRISKLHADILIEEDEDGFDILDDEELPSGIREKLKDSVKRKDEEKNNSSDK